MLHVAIKCILPFLHIVQEKYGDQDDSDSSPSEIEDDTAYVISDCF